MAGLKVFITSMHMYIKFPCNQNHLHNNDKSTHVDVCMYVCTEVIYLKKSGDTSKSSSNIIACLASLKMCIRMYVV